MTQCPAIKPAAPNQGTGAITLYLCGILLLLVLTTAARAQAPAADYPKKISFHNIMKNQDIALGEVEAITQDHQGFMWLGGRNALLRYDGYEFLTIPVADNPQDLTQTSPVNQIVDLLEDSQQNLWAATRSGLYRYDREHELLVPVRNAQGALAFTVVTYALDEGPDGELIIGSGDGLYIFNPKTLESQLLNHNPGNPDSLPSNPVQDVYMDRAGHTLWLGVNEGLFRIDWPTKKARLVTLNPEDPKSGAANGVRSIAADHKGNIWAATDLGIYRLDPTSGAIKHYRHDPEDPYTIGNDLTRQVYVDKQGWVWTGSDSGGLGLYDQDRDRFLRFEFRQDSPGSLSSNTIRRIYENDNGDLWVGTYPSGVNVYDRSSAAIRVYRREAKLEQGVLDNNVEAVEEDKAGNLWIGASGVTRYNPANESFTHYINSSGSDSRVPSGSILNGLVDSQGDIRFGSWAHGELIYNPTADRFDEVPVDATQVTRGEKSGELLNDKMVWSVYEDREKNLWFGTHFNGITKLDRKTGRYHFYPQDSQNTDAVSCPVVWTSFEDSRGRFWVGTAYGLNLMDREKGTFKHYLPTAESAKGLVNGSVLSIAEDHKGRVWFGTDMGLHLYHPDTDSFTAYTTKDGFADQGIRAILEDNSGNLWLGTNNGFVMFNPDTGRVKNFVRYNGEMIGGVSTGAATRMRTGELAFGTRNGLYIIDPAKLQTNQKLPPVMLTDFRIFTQKVPVGGPEKILTKAISQTDKVTLDYTKSMISFSFAALNFRDPEKNLYAYKLEGFDNDWRYLTTQRTALYTNLPAGTYRFHVKASNNDGIWNEQGQSIALVILPPPWKTWWAYSLYTLLALALIFWFVYSQHQQVVRERKTSRDLEQKVAERTAELSHKNNELEEAYAQLEAISLSDPLTGLSNRRYLQKLMPMDVAKIQRGYDGSSDARKTDKSPLDLTFLILDVDHFKSVNDIYGHAAGDQLLIEFSELLTQACRESDCVVRWGGEEFLIVSRFTDRNEAPLVAERIRHIIEQHEFTLPSGIKIHKTCSIGFACFPFLHERPQALSWEQVIDIADQALYAAKKSGRNRYVGITANANTTEAMLHQRISRNVKGMIKNQELGIIAQDTETITWD
jgi:diguanylate cyclase (GGDEF)-like protein